MYKSMYKEQYNWSRATTNKLLQACTCKIARVQARAEYSTEVKLTDAEVPRASYRAKQIC